MDGSPEKEAGDVAKEAAAWDSRRAGLTVTFERIVVFRDAAVASFIPTRGQGRLFISLEWTGKEWEPLTTRLPEPDAEGAGRWRSLRPSEFRPGWWTGAAGGSAPADATSALIAFGGEEHTVPVVDGIYLFAAGAANDPGPPELRGFR